MGIGSQQSAKRTFHREGLLVGLISHRPSALGTINPLACVILRPEGPKNPIFRLETDPPETRFSPAPTAQLQAQVSFAPLAQSDEMRQAVFELRKSCQSFELVMLSAAIADAGDSGSTFRSAKFAARQR